MIVVALHRGPDGGIRRFEVDGHAGYARKGKDDIVCSAVSALAYTAVGALKDLAGAEPDWNERDGHMECRMPEPDRAPQGDADKARTILETFALGCRQIEASYGSQYVRVTDAAFEPGR